jgi:Trk-type K+ transport system membrane component
VDIWLDEDEFYEIVVEASVGDVIVGNCTVVDANISAPIMLLVLDSEHFSVWVNESLYVPHVYRYSMSSEFSFLVPYADTWHVVFWNDPVNPGAKHVVGGVDHLTDVTTTTTTTTDPITPVTVENFTSQLWIIIIGALGVVAVALMVLIWIIRRGDDTEYVSWYDLPRSEGGIFPSTDSD